MSTSTEARPRPRLCQQIDANRVNCDDERPASSHESIATWLSNLPSPPKSSLKRKSTLEEADPNIMAAARSVSPTKRRRQMDSADKDDYVDLEMTSHASLQPSKAVVPPPMSIRSGSPSKPIKSGASERSKSPTKRMGQMYLRPRPTVLKSFYDRKMALPEGLSEMLSTVARYGRGFGVISESRKVSLAEFKIQNSSQNLIPLYSRPVSQVYLSTILALRKSTNMRSTTRK